MHLEITYLFSYYQNLQAWAKSSRLRNVGTDAEACVQDRSPQYERLETVHYWQAKNPHSVVDKAFDQWRIWMCACWKADRPHFKYLVQPGSYFRAI